MPHQSMTTSVAADGADRISALPDGVLHDILGFLEADEAVRTSVLAWRWRGLWRFVPALHVTRGGTISSCRSFVDHLLNLRGRSDLHTCFFSFNEPSWLSDSDDDHDCLNRWTRYALLQQVQELTVGVQVETSVHRCVMDNLRVVSQSLTKLQLAGLDLFEKSLDFSRCPALEELTLTKCRIDETGNMSSSSLVCLYILECEFTEQKRVRISTPNIVSLQVTNCSGLTPIFEFMPALVSAIILNWKSRDCCFDGDPGLAGYCVDAMCPWCYEVDDGSEGCVLLKGISAASNLELVSAAHMYILKGDLRFCPTFSKLQTLLLNGWCVVGEQCALSPTFACSGEAYY